MDLKQIQYFIRIAELGSFTKASIELNVAQPALSRQIRLLEVELRQSLLIRNGRGVDTTEAGKVLLEHGRGVLHQIERIRQELMRVRSGLVGRVAVGLPPSLTKLLTVPLIKAFRTELPGATISINEGLSTMMQAMLINGSLDVALLYNAAPSPEIDQTPILTQALYLVQPRDPSLDSEPVTLRQVADLPLIIPSRPNAFRMQLETQLAGLGLHPSIAIEVDAIAGLLDLVADGIGSAILPYSTIQVSGREEDFTVRPIIEPPMLAKLCCAVSSRRPTSQVQRHLIQLIETKVRELIH